MKMNSIQSPLDLQMDQPEPFDPVEAIKKILSVTISSYPFPSHVQQAIGMILTPESVFEMAILSFLELLQHQSFAGLNTKLSHAISLVYFADASIIYFGQSAKVHSGVSSLELADKGLLCSSGAYTFSLLLLKNSIDNPYHQQLFGELVTQTWLTRSNPFLLPSAVSQAIELEPSYALVDGVTQTLVFQDWVINACCVKLLRGELGLKF